MLQITDAEARVMEVLWAAGAPLSAEEIAAGLRGPQRWQLATIKTLVNRLLNKGAIRARKDGRRYLYSPRLRRERWVGAQASGLLDRLFGGSLAPLVAHFGNQRPLRADEVEALRRLLESYEQEGAPQSPEIAGRRRPKS